MSFSIVGQRVFTPADQDWFASVSEDINPMHMDALAARRTMAGFPVVHGIHTLLWSLDSLLAAVPDLPPIATLKADFEKMVYIGDEVRCVLLNGGEQTARLETMIGDQTVMGLDIGFGDPRAADMTPAETTLHHPAQPYDLTFAQMETQRGQIPLACGRLALGERFPDAVRVFGIERAAGLAASSYLVGMVCPGLHSIYRNLNLAMAAITPGGLNFRVKYSDEDYRLIRLAVWGAGWTGLVDSYGRPPPAAQTNMASLAQRIVPGEFVGSVALVIGGSRGLGELTAKLLAAGGARVIVTYAVGQADAARVQAEIVASGGQCDILRYDIRHSAEEQIAALPVMPTDIYYMATPQIFQRAEAGFSRDRLQDFLNFYVIGFSALCRALPAQSRPDIAVFYPSSVSIDERPANMTEYTMAKAAGEVLCQDMRSFETWRHILIRRLPRLPTDQTATLYEDDQGDPVTEMLPILRAMHATQAVSAAMV